MATAAQVPAFYNYTQANHFRLDIHSDVETEVNKWLNELDFPSLGSSLGTSIGSGCNWGSSIPLSYQAYGVQGGVFPFLPPQSQSSSYAASSGAYGLAAPSLSSVPLNSQLSYIYQYSKPASSCQDLHQEDGSDDKKRKRERERTFVRRVRQTRPKVVEAKGAIQCQGTNRKRGAQCRNAALMEFIGPRPRFCAEHIELDPESLYEKCKSSYQKEPGDNKGCKEVVLKEFGVCYKHYLDRIHTILQEADLPRARFDLKRINELLSQLEREAAAAKKKDGDLYQRKNKLIPKFLEMKKFATRAVEEILARTSADGSNPLDDNCAILNFDPKELGEQKELVMPFPSSLPLMDIDLRSIELKQFTDSEGELSFEGPF